MSEEKDKINELWSSIKAQQEYIKSLESRLKEVSEEKDGCIRLLQIANDNQRKELMDKDAEIQRVNQHAFQREESLKKRLQLMGEKVAEFRKIEAFKIFEKNQSLEARLSQAEAEKSELIRVSEVLQKTINETRKRLSNLMDVAGKMAGCLRVERIDSVDWVIVDDKETLKSALDEYRSFK